MKGYHKSNVKTRTIYSILVVAIALVASFAIYQYKVAGDYKVHAENQYQRSFSELVDYVGNIEVELKKGKAVTDTAQMVTLASDIWRKASFAQSNLGQLPISDIDLENTSNFLAQVGDYTYSLSKKLLNGSTITEEEKEQMNNLSKYATDLSESLSQMQDQVYAGDISFGDIGKTSRVFAKEEPFGSGMQSIEEEFADYPSLIYDGPFSEHVNRMTPKLIENEPEISPAEAQQRLEQFLGSDRINKIEHTGDGEGTIRTYSFTVTTNEDDVTINADVTRQGGYIVWMLDNKQVLNQNIDEEQAVEKAKQFLQSRGYQNMKESYFERSGNTLYANFAYVQDGIVVYNDLIKVKVSLDNGEIIGFESHGYIMNHEDKRELVPITVTPEQARAIADSVMEVETQALTIIPLETRAESLCYEFKGRIDEDEYLIYINAQTGRQDKILLLLVNENGTLTI